MLQPIACEDTNASVRFSNLVYTVKFFLLIARSSIVSGQEWLTILHSSMPSFILSYSSLPSESSGSRCFRSGSCTRFELIQSLNANCSSTRTECVVPAADESDMPPSVSRFSFFETTFLNVLATSFAFRSMHSDSNSSYDSLPTCCDRCLFEYSSIIRLMM
uniref:Uncharacterized protein n=1 Tax=Anopheles merus TaxID=30066 RepID=A0A182VGJ5_ANOME